MKNPPSPQLFKNSEVIVNQLIFHPGLLLIISPYSPWQNF